MGPVGTHDVEDRAAPADDVRTEPPYWWHRDHPTFTALEGFFSGSAFLCLVQEAYVGLTRLILADETAEAVFPFVIVLLAVPVGLVITERTRRFGRYMLFGMLVCAVVVIGVA